MGVLASPAGRKPDRRSDANRTQRWLRYVTFGVRDDGQMRVAYVRVADLPGLFQYGPGVVVHLDQAGVDRGNDSFDGDVPLWPGRGRLRAP